MSDDLARESGIHPLDTGSPIKVTELQQLREPNPMNCLGADNAARFEAALKR